MPSPDSLYKIFEQELMNLSIEDDSIELFITRVTDEYLGEISCQGFMPLNLIENIREDVKLEVRDMLRIKTYGYFDLNEYRATVKK